MSRCHHSAYSVTVPLPFHNEEKCCTPAATKLWRYFRRMSKVNQMDFEYALWQMMYLFVAPQKVYRSFKYRKNTKSQFARDDPAFFVLLLAWFCFMSSAFGIVFRLNFWKFVKFISYMVFFDFIGSGLVFATIFWYVLNKCFASKRNQKIEWGFAFDVHLNALFPALTVIQWCQLLIFNGILINYDWSIIIFIGNTSWFIAASYYIYITFLGYNSLQVLKHSYLLLMPLLISLLLYMISLSVGFNMTYVLTKYYSDRIGDYVNFI